jgi:23S rRNA (cytidine1920-2'-O)/16S rRNA (cytidine1409-2'-O)-methyltransferase
VKKKRLDLLLVEKGFSPSRSRAQAEIMAGNVYINGKLINKGGTLVNPEAELYIKPSTNPYVSRGGLKLQKALVFFAINLHDRVVLDIGASTGGFTDCALQNGARKVYAVDVGYGQLDWKLRQNRRVVNMEKKNFRYLSLDDFSETIDFAVVDVSFISLKLVFPVLRSLCVPEAITLIKPQFEAGPQNVGKGGVVRDPFVQQEVIGSIIGFAAKESYGIQKLTFSEVRGPKGNIEYLGYFIKGQDQEPVDVAGVVKEAHFFFSN